MNILKILLLLASIASAYPAQSWNMTQMNDQERIRVILARARANRLARGNFLFH